MDPAHIAMAFSVGLFSSLHCLGMCGGITGALTLSLPGQVRDDRRGLALFTAGYNVGRIGAYAAFGALVGGFGAEAFALIAPDSGHLALRAIAAMVMVSIGLYVAGLFPAFALVEGLGEPLWRRVEPLGRRVLPARTPLHALAYGMVWGLVPCGLVYGTLLWAGTSGGPLAGASVMAGFGLGTVPAMAGGAFLSHRLLALRRRRGVREAVGGTIVVVGLASVIYSGSLAEALCAGCASP